MRKNGYVWTSGVNLDTTIRFPDRDFLHSATFGRFFDVFRWVLHFICWKSAIFLLPVCLAHWPKSVLQALTHTAIIFTKFEVDMTIHCRVTVSVLAADTSRNLVTLTFDLLTNLANKFEDHMPIRSWVMSSNVSRWLPLKMRTRPPRMRPITWPVSRGSKTIITFLECLTQICLFTMQLRWLYDESN